MTVTWIEPTVIDNSGMAPTVRISHSPGSNFPVGTTDILYIFSDMAGNEAVCSFSVTVGKYITFFIWLWKLRDLHN